MRIPVKITWAGLREAGLAYLLMGLPLTFMMMVLWKAGGWRAVGEVLLVTAVGTSVVYLLVRRYAG
jgi:hypothetical protein